MTGLLILLGATNSHDGQLSPMAIDRLICAYHFLKNNPEFSILCTGGFGNHFNTSDYPHAQYLQHFLLEREIDPRRFTEFALSENTIEDAQLSRQIISRYNPAMVAVLSSDFTSKEPDLLFRSFVLSAICFSLKQNQAFLKKTWQGWSVRNKRLYRGLCL
ncbi:YdcF family protein [Pseudarcicella hirudinis]|uniref:YdcF family protein n=1 Tax=Pseudarcicella hirudinis TaxID=1079859 RepID=UPI0035E72359